MIRYADHEETFRAGDAYYAAPGHLPLVFAGAEVVEFSPTDAAAGHDGRARREHGGAGAGPMTTTDGSATCRDHG